MPACAHAGHRITKTRWPPSNAGVTTVVIPHLTHGGGGGWNSSGMVEGPFAPVVRRAFQKEASLRPMGAWFPAPLPVACRQALVRGHLRTSIPSLCHPAPHGLAIRVACEFGHKLAVEGVFQKFLRRMHRVITLPGAPRPLRQSQYIESTEKGKESRPVDGIVPVLILPPGRI